MKQIVMALVFITVGCLSAKAQQGILLDLTQEQEVVTDSLAAIYATKLVLTGEQELMFKQKLGEYLVKKKELKKKVEGINKLNALQELSLQENGEMRDILTDEQFDLYTRIKPSIQPLEVIQVADDN
ncbi:MAG: hypothetical protein CL868_15490 [Cytophagaceae bacterium]|nr:hypothetical protein [Cytophagaceae bacterium]|tara:strand:+ start:1964 stop:2344 length:381 start_codon:yes stop_codon:yes gene_type:complete